MATRPVPPPPPGFVLLDDNSSVPPPPPGFRLVQSERAAAPRRASSPATSVEPDARPHDGDTFPLGDGSGRLYGVDAPELRQQGFQRDGTAIPIGIASRDYLAAQLADGAQFQPNGAASYGRPVGSLLAGGDDVGSAMLDAGMGVAAPDYLRGDPVRLGAYMEAERLARLNRRGNFNSAFQSPDAYRRKEPWAAAEASQDGKGVAFFPDEPTPFQGLRPEIEQAYLALASDRASTPDDLVAFARDNGFTIARKDAVKFVVQRNKGAKVGQQVAYEALPAPLTNVGDGAGGALVRGLADPVNFLDEAGAVVDTLGGTGGRENVWNSDRRFGDILANNIDQNRSILAYDDVNHPYARFAGQLASGLAIPGGSVEGVGFGAARTALRAGAGRFGAEAAAKSAVRNRLVATGAVEGGVAGAGAGEGGPIHRLPSALIGTGAGAAAGTGLSLLAPYLSRAGRAVRDALPFRRGRSAQDVVEPAAIERAPVDPPTQVAAVDAANGREPAQPKPEIPAARSPEPEVAADWMARTDAGRERYARSAGNLWRMAPDDLEALHGQALAAERAQLRDALARAGVVETPGMGLGGENMERASDRVRRAVEAKLGDDLPDDIDRLISPRWEDHQEGGLPNAEDVAEVLRGHGLAIEGDDSHALASEVGWALRDLKPGDLEAVAGGSGSVSAQRAMVTMQNGYRALQAQGVTSAQMPGLIRDAMVRNGVSPGTADELTGAVFEMLQPTASRGAQAASQPRLPGRTADLPAPAPATGDPVADPFRTAAMQAEQLPPVLPVRAARTLAEARDHALDFVGQPIRNEESGLAATVSGGNLKKMTSQSAVSKSTSEADHMLAVANVDELFRRASRVGSAPDERGEPTIAAISRWHAPFDTPDGRRIARMTVKETSGPDQPNPLYTVESMEVEPARMAPQRGIERAPGQNRNTPQAGSEADINPAADLGNAPLLGRTRRMDEQVDAARLADMAGRADPRDITPLPANTIGSLDEAVRGMPSTDRLVRAPDERDTLPPFTLPDGRTRRQPLDLVGWLRTRGGVQDQGGELRALGIDNAPRRDLDFAKDEAFLGRLVNPEGMSLDDAAFKAWEAGFFPDHAERPSINDFLDALGDTHRGTRRAWRPDDLDTVAQFKAARDQRRAVEQAQADGAPFYEEVGEAVSMADLDANQAPATAYEDLPSVAGKAGNIDVSKLETRGDIFRAIHSVHKAVGGFDAARRSKISHGETEALARDLRMTPEDLMKRRQGQALNAEQALAARSILAKSADELVRMAEKAKGGSDADLATFRVAWMRHVAIQEQVAGATAEAGRALSQFRAMAKSKLPIGRIHQLQIDGAGGREDLEKAAQSILDARADPRRVNQNARLLASPTWKDKAVELYYNSLLSGPQTHAVNILSNTITALAQLPEHAVAAGIGQLRRGSADRVLGSEIGARAVGLLQGTKEGLWQAARTMRTGEASDFLSKVESAEKEAISGAKGKVIRTPTRALSAEDELFKAMARRMQISGLAVRTARAEGLKGDALTRRTAELVANPTDDMVESAFDYGRYLTFQTPLGAFGNWVSSGTNKFPPLKLIAPFIRTPTNILKYAIERSPAAPALREWRADMAAGGARRDLAIARTMIGSGIGALATQWAADGILTGGGPADEKAKRLLEADGWQPYSVRIGDRYYSYRRLDPYATTLGLAADMVELRSHMTDRQRENVGSLLAQSLLQNLASKTWLSGLADFAQMIGDPGRYAESWISGTAGSIAVPAIAAQTARTIDPLVREARGPIDRIRSRVPGLSQRLEPRRNVLGEPIKAEGGLGPDMVTPIWTKQARNDPTIAKLLSASIGITAPSRRINDRELTPAEYGVYAERVGAIAKPLLDALVGGEGWETMARDDRDDAVDRVMRGARRDAKAELGLAGFKAGQAVPPPPPGFDLVQ